MKIIKITIILLVTVSINFTLLSCNKSPEKKEEVKKTAEKHDRASQELTKTASQQTQKEDPFNPNSMKAKKVEKSKDDGKIITITGKLTRTKGAQPMVAGKILDSDYVKIEGHKNWKPKFEKMYGKVVEVKGRLKVNYCDPRLQCLSGGKIEFIKDIEYIKLKK